MIRHCNWRWGFNTRARTLAHAHTHMQRVSERGRGRERDRGENPFFSCACRCPLASPSLNISATLARSLPCGTPLVAHARPGFIWRCWDEQKSCYFRLFKPRNDAPVPLGFQLSWKLRLGNNHVIQCGQSGAVLLPDADIPLDKSAPPSRTSSELVLMATCASPFTV